MQTTAEMWRQEMDEWVAEWTAETRARLGPDLPSDEDVARYVDGLMSKPEVERMREFICAYPEVMDVVLLAVHTRNEAPMNDAMREDWEKIRARLGITTE